MLLLGVSATRHTRSLVRCRLLATPLSQICGTVLNFGGVQAAPSQPLARGLRILVLDPCAGAYCFLLHSLKETGQFWLQACPVPFGAPQACLALGSSWVPLMALGPSCTLGPSWHWVPPRPWVPPGFWVCLLYTSDAADE